MRCAAISRVVLVSQFNFSYRRFPFVIELGGLALAGERLRRSIATVLITAKTSVYGKGPGASPERSGSLAPARAFAAKDGGGQFERPLLNRKPAGRLRCHTRERDDAGGWREAEESRARAIAHTKGGADRRIQTGHRGACKNPR